MKRVLMGLLLLGSASAAELRFYPNFAEVRDTLGVPGTAVTVTLPESVWMNVVPGSLDLLGVNVTSRSQVMAQPWLAKLEGQPVTLFENGEAQRVTLVRARDLLVRDARGVHRTVPFDRLGFDVPPPPNPFMPERAVTFNVAQAGAGTLSYLTRGVSWSPRYDLRLTGQRAELAALAEMVNATEQAYEVTNGELIAGDVNLVEGPMEPYGRGGGMDVALESRAAPEPAVVARGETGGLYRYDLTRAFVLPPNGSVSLPFLEPEVTADRYYALNTGFGSRGERGKLQRAYRVTSDVLLPAGTLTVRDEGRVVGQTRLQDTPAGEPAEFTLGRDPDVGYVREVQVLRQDRTGSAYRVTLTLTNEKARPVTAEVRENLPAAAKVQGDVQRPPEGLLIKAQIPANGRVTRSYTVEFVNER